MDSDISVRERQAQNIKVSCILCVSGGIAFTYSKHRMNSIINIGPCNQYHCILLLFKFVYYVAALNSYYQVEKAAYLKTHGRLAEVEEGIMVEEQGERLCILLYLKWISSPVIW